MWKEYFTKGFWACIGAIVGFQVLGIATVFLIAFVLAALGVPTLRTP